MFARKFYFDVQSAAVGNAVAPDISLAVVSYMDDTAVLGVELTYRVVYGVAAVLTESNDNFVLQLGFGVNKDRLLRKGGDLVALFV